MQTNKKTHLIAAAIIRRGSEIVLVEQRGPNDLASSWALPAGVAEPGELLTEALVREVREETGLDVLDPGKLIYVAQLDNPHPQQIHENAGPGSGYLATTFVFEVSNWAGTLHTVDPDGFVLEAQFTPTADAIDKLETHPFRVMHEPIVAYLRGQVGSGAMWFYRRQSDGQDVLVTQLENRRT